MLLRISAFAYFIFIAFTIVSVNLGWKWFFLEWTSSLPYRDKILHFFLIGILSFFVNLLLKGKRVSLFSKSILLGCLGLVIFTTIEECSQHFLVRRNFELLDMACNYMGIFVFGNIAERFHKAFGQ